MSTYLLVFPHQLFAEHPGLEHATDEVWLVEDSLFFGDDRYPARFHKQKLWLHRATMKRYQEFLDTKGMQTRYLEYQPGQSLQKQLREIPRRSRVRLCDPVDFILEKRIKRFAANQQVTLEILTSPGFVNTADENRDYRAGKKRWFMADFYKWQRTRLNVLMDGDQPQGGKWSFDKENRKKVPKKQLDKIPALPQVTRDKVDNDARDYVERNFAGNPGSLEALLYPTSHAAAVEWLEAFLSVRLQLFGDYEDAIVEGESWLWHSVLTPMLNVGLLTPNQVLETTLRFTDSHEVPINSLEGFVRQVLGWREFIRATYEDLGVTMRTKNHWRHVRTMPDCFYDGTTGITPIDDTIQRLLKTGYCHHIERLMVLGGLMFLCELDPEDIYRWFMEMFVDSYDWVMVPNVYAMSQHADGGLITTKPYFSGSAYIRKMSHYPQGPWCDIWDGLYWRWILKHIDALAKSPRWAMMCSTAKRMAPEKQSRHIQVAEEFLRKLDEGQTS